MRRTDPEEAPENGQKRIDGGYSPSFKQSPKRSALGNLPADEDSFPVSTWLKSFLTQGIQQFVLNSQLIRKAVHPGKDGTSSQTDPICPGLLRIF